jgi:hypothetical protein
VLPAAVDASSPQRLALDVLQHYPKTVVLLDRESLETTLPDVPGGVIVALAATDTG